MAGPVPDAGEQVPCPSCNQQVLMKSMIPIFQNGTKSYVCMECARKLISHAEAGDAGAEGEGEGEGDTGAEAEEPAAVT